MTETPSACQCFCELLWYFLSSVNSSHFLKEKDYCTLTSHHLIRFYTTDSSYTLRCCLFSVASHLRIYFDLMKEGCKKLKGKSSITIYMPETYTSPWLLLAVSFSLFNPYWYMFLLINVFIALYGFSSTAYWKIMSLYPWKVTFRKNLQQLHSSVVVHSAISSAHILFLQSKSCQTTALLQCDIHYSKCPWRG